MYSLEGDKYDLERQIRLKQFEVITIGLPKRESLSSHLHILFLSSLSPRPLSPILFIHVIFLTLPRAWPSDTLGRTVLEGVSSWRVFEPSVRARLHVS